MPFIPDDILLAAMRGDDNELRVLMHYAMICQNEREEPGLDRLAESAHLPPETVQAALTALSSRGWLERVKDYSE